VSGSIKCGEFRGWLSRCKLIEDSAPWSLVGG